MRSFDLRLLPSQKIMILQDERYYLLTPILKFKELDRGLLKRCAVIVGSEVVILGAFIIISIKILSSDLWC